MISRQFSKFSTAYTSLLKLLTEVVPFLVGMKSWYCEFSKPPDSSLLLSLLWVFFIVCPLVLPSFAWGGPRLFCPGLSGLLQVFLWIVFSPLARCDLAFLSPFFQVFKSGFFNPSSRVPRMSFFMAFSVLCHFFLVSFCPRLALFRIFMWHASLHRPSGKKWGSGARDAQCSAWVMNPRLALQNILHEPCFNR